MTLSRRGLLAGCASMMLAACRRREPPPAPAAAPRTVDLFIESDGDFLAFTPDTLMCPTGAIVRLTFHHGGKFLSARHNWVLVRPGQMEAVDKSVEHEEGLVSKDDPRVIAFTPMCDKGASVMIQFAAPGPGDYPFFCSTPGHGECMNGILRVINDL